MDRFAIFNPAAGRGAGTRRLPIYSELLDRHLGTQRWAPTTAPGE